MPLARIRSSRSTRLAALSLVAALAVLAGGTVRHAEAEPLSFPAAADAVVRLDLPTMNFGTLGSIAVSGAPWATWRSYLRFDVALPAGTVVTKASLQLHAVSGARPTVELRAVPDTSWRETTITAASAPAIAPALVSRTTSYTNGASVSLDVTPLVTRPGPVSVALTTTSRWSQIFASRENAGRQPRLVIETAPAPVPAPAPPPSLVPAPVAGTVLFGAAAEGVPWDLSGLDAMSAAAGKSPGLVMWYQDFAHFPDFEPALAQRILDRGAQAMLTWEPWDYTGGPNQPAYSLSRIIDGTHDAHIRRWAVQIKAWNKPLFLRFAHEMNGNWNSWSEGVNGNQPGQYVQAYRHVWEIFRSVGASNVSWVWSPNVVYSNSPPLAPFFPGDAYVDRVALDGYNWGSVLPDWQAWLSFEDIFGPGLAQLRALSAKPVMIAEMASTELGGNKAAWITETFAALARHPEIVAFTWFNFDKETDWRIQSSPSAKAAFAAGVGDPRYIAASR